MIALLQRVSQASISIESKDVTKIQNGLAIYIGVQKEDTEIVADLLVKKGKELHLVNTKKATIPGVNPIRFNSLEEYADFSQWSQRVGLKCPILYFEQTYDAQNKRGYRMLNDPLNPKPGLSSDPNLRTAKTVLLTDSNRDDPPYNQNNFSGYDPDDQTIGTKTPLDTVTLQTGEGSYSPADPNWVGKKKTCHVVNLYFEI